MLHRSDNTMHILHIDTFHIEPDSDCNDCSTRQRRYANEPPAAAVLEYSVQAHQLDNDLYWTQCSIQNVCGNMKSSSMSTQENKKTRAQRV
jgi:hypothetical protein